jgi:mono/diheme cytochrome c family protein
MLSCDYRPRNQGAALYREHCQNCHMENGQGLGTLMPPVADSDYVIENIDLLACIIRFGQDEVVTVNDQKYEGVMPGNRQLNDVEINNLIHFLVEVLNHQQNTYTISDIRKQLESCED